ncbi:MAG TPA: sensor histidine kinase [Anaerolineae bacterium]|nr:sensor histidine kinase [Anaerolineae bacterium]
MRDEPYSFRARPVYTGIQWRLTATYVVVTVFAILAVEVAVALDVIPRSLALLVGAAAIAGGTFGFVTARVIKLRLRAIARASAAIAAGDLSQRLVIDGDDEIAELAEQFNEMAARLDANAAELRQLAAAAERSRLASELHDSVNQQIFSISMLAAAARKKLGDQPLAPDLARLETLAREAHAEMRALIRELRPAALDGADLSVALSRYVSDFEERYGLTVNVSAQPVGRLPIDLDTALFRIAQEALGNAVRHSAAKHIDLGLRHEGSTLELTVQDDGRGFDLTAHSDGLGLHSMGERARSIGGTYQVSSEPGRGCLVRVRVPLR